MLLSVIIPVYNVEPYIERCLRSVINQADPNEVEVILVDDCGNDNSMGVVHQVANGHPNGGIVRIIRHERNQGLSAARNTGLSVAKGTYVWFVDSDDWIKENYLQYLSDILHEQELDICLFSAADCFAEQCIQRFSYPELAGQRVEGKYFIVHRKVQVCVPFSIYKRSFLLDNQLKFKVGIYHEDVEFSLRAFYFAKRVTYINEILYFYYQNPASITQTINPKKSFDNIVVAESLYEFSKSYVEQQYLSFFYNYISLAINEALHGFYKIKDPSVKKEWEKKIFERKHLITVLSKSSIVKYRVEGVLFKICNRYIAVYRLLQLFNKKTYLKILKKNKMSIR